MALEIQFTLLETALVYREWDSLTARCKER